MMRYQCAFSDTSNIVLSTKLLRFAVCGICVYFMKRKRGRFNFYLSRNNILNTQKLLILHTIFFLKKNLIAHPLRPIGTISSSLNLVACFTFPSDPILGGHWRVWVGVRA